MNSESGDTRRPSSANAWVIAVVCLVLYVISPPFVLKMVEGFSGGALPPPGSAIEMAFTIFYWPLSKLEETGLRQAMEQFYRWEGTFLGVKGF